MKARKKATVIVDVHQVFSSDKLDSYPDWLISLINNDYIIFTNADMPENDIGYIRTLEGKLYIGQGDFIIKGIDGECYACKPDIFHRTYDILS